jgi:hypothetical protein
VSLVQREEQAAVVEPLKWHRQKGQISLLFEQEAALLEVAVLFEVFAHRLPEVAVEQIEVLVRKPLEVAVGRIEV